MPNPHSYRHAVHSHGCRKDATARGLKENAMYRMTLREQADVLARIAATAPCDSARSVAIEAVRGDRATALQVMEIYRCLQRWADIGTGNARDEARRALARWRVTNQGCGGKRRGETTHRRTAVIGVRHYRQRQQSAGFKATLVALFPYAVAQRF
jgi:hypothetical protein